MLIWNSNLRMYLSNALISCESKNMIDEALISFINVYILLYDILYWFICGSGAKITFSRSYRKAWKQRKYIIIIIIIFIIKSNHPPSHTHIQFLSLSPHQSGVSLGLSLLGGQEVHLHLVTLQELPADNHITNTWDLHWNFTTLEAELQRA